MDKIKNETIRNNLNAESANSVIERSQLRWFGHLNRMNQDRQVKKIWEAREYGKARKERPRKRWNDVITEALQRREITWPEAKQTALNRKQWRELIRK
ncbi:hypothetical protein Zmor_003595 [Zophobas morio]|uniref:Endonuclease-reverse transcriptase n=1 Tax=Zophobas morio TaxID=2755281 RepID=A0AA38HNN7_9CUCU|nr:hypothetical protein Zmor_003595 [Zophobas morio]